MLNFALIQVTENSWTSSTKAQCNKLIHHIIWFSTVVYNYFWGGIHTKIKQAHNREEIKKYTFKIFNFDPTIFKAGIDFCFYYDFTLINSIPTTILSWWQVLNLCWKFPVLSSLQNEDIEQDIFSEDMSKKCPKQKNLNVLISKLIWGRFLCILKAQGHNFKQIKMQKIQKYTQPIFKAKEAQSAISNLFDLVFCK